VTPRRVAAQELVVLARDPEQRDVPAEPAGQRGQDVVCRVVDGRRVGEQPDDL
jgi:hypothetical protein